MLAEVVGEALTPRRQELFQDCRYLPLDGGIDSTPAPVPFTERFFWLSFAGIKPCKLIPMKVISKGAQGIVFGKSTIRLSRNIRLHVLSVNRLHIISQFSI